MVLIETIRTTIRAAAAAAATTTTTAAEIVYNTQSI